MTKSKQTTKHRVFEIIQIGNRSDTVSRAFDYLIMTLIIANIAAMFLDTFEQFRSWHGVFRFIEIFTVSVFIVEYILRLWTAVYLYPERTPTAAALRFVRSFDGIVDLLTILPVFFLSGMVVFRMMRVVRILRLFKINANFDSFNVITSVLYEKRRQLISSIFIILILMLAASLSMYSAEHEAQPDQFKNAFSGIWWSVSTLLTVGYGDIYPITLAGRIMAIIITFLGVGVVAIPTGIISAGFVEQYTELSNNTDESDIHLHSIVIDADSAWIGKSMTYTVRVGDFVIAYKNRSADPGNTMNA